MRQRYWIITFQYKRSGEHWQNATRVAVPQLFDSWDEAHAAFILMGDFDVIRCFLQDDLTKLSSSIENAQHWIDSCRRIERDRRHASRCNPSR